MVVKIREFQEDDFEEIAQMYHSLLKEVYPNHNIKPILYACRNIMNWIDWNYDIMVTYKDDEITGFGLCLYGLNGWSSRRLTIKARLSTSSLEYRKGRSAYLIYHTAIITGR
jgi:hypothetical protein